MRRWKIRLEEFSAGLQEVIRKTAAFVQLLNDL
jgi:hypothetical protein